MDKETENHIEQKIDALATAVQNGFVEVHQKFAELHKKMDDGFERVDKRFDRIETRLSGHGYRIETLEKDVSHLKT